jgi:hypothetical protein
VKSGRVPIQVEKERFFRKEYEAVNVLHFGLHSSSKITISGDPEVMAMMKMMKMFIFVSDPSAAAKENSEQAKCLHRLEELRRRATLTLMMPLSMLDCGGAIIITILFNPRVIKEFVIDIRVLRLVLHQHLDWFACMWVSLWEYVARTAAVQ